MYTLRIIEETRENEKVPFDQVIENFEVGESYSIIKKGFSKEYDKEMAEWTDSTAESVTAILKCENGKTFHIVKNNEFRNYTYYIMTESGKTFEKL